MVVHGHFIALLGLALAFDRKGDIDLEVLGGNDGDGSGRQEGEEKHGLHFDGYTQRGESMFEA